jgi:hypothetical protein
MKRTFQLQIEGKKPERVLDSIKHEVRKYLKRERRRALPLDADYWDFDCKYGVSEATAEVVHLSSVIGHIDETSKNAGTQLYVEIVAVAKKRKPKLVRSTETNDVELPHDSQTEDEQTP